jgi:hypothetical protein
MGEFILLQVAGCQLDNSWWLARQGFVYGDSSTMLGSEEPKQ